MNDQTNAHEYALQLLKTKSEDSQREREAQRSQRRDQMAFAGFALAMITGLIVYAMHIGKDQIALEALKDIALFGVGGMGGYAIGRQKSTDSADDKS
jgi:hypothetical protein